MNTQVVPVGLFRDVMASQMYGVQLFQLSSGLDNFQNDWRYYQGDMRAVQSDLRSVQGDMKAVQGDLRSVQGDMKAVQGDLRSLQGDMKSVQGDMKSVPGDIRSVQDDLTSLQAQMESLQAEQSHQEGLLEGLAAKLISRTDLIVTKQDQLHCAVVGDTITPLMTSPQAESKLTWSDRGGPQPPFRVSIGKADQCSYASSYQSYPSDSLQYNFDTMFEDLGLADLFSDKVAKHAGTASPVSAGSGWTPPGSDSCHRPLNHQDHTLLFVLNNQVLLLPL